MTKNKPQLPKHPPKKTGKRGVGPLDTEKDFKEPVKKPRQQRLPMMEDPEIEELENSAEEYADFRDQRMELTKEETRCKTELLGLMKKHGRTSYVHDGYDIKVIVESEKLRVRVKKEE